MAPVVRKHLWRLATIGMCCLCASPARSADAQQTVAQALSFLLTNRSVGTDDFARDEQAAAATRDAVSALLVAQLGALPISSSASGFTYRFNPAFGAPERSSDSFGPFLVERALTTGRHRVSFGTSYQRSTYQTIDGRSLRDGSLVSTASQIRGEAAPFDVETVTLLLTTDTTTFSLHWGVTDRLELSAALPIVRLSLSGRRIDTYRGQAFDQATVAASASGPGDLVVRTKYNFGSHGASGIAAAADLKLASGDASNLLGADRTTVAPALIASLERDRIGLHGDVSYALGATPDVGYGAAATFVASPRVTLVGELSGRRFSSAGHLTEVTAPNPVVGSVDTIRLTSVSEPAARLVSVVGLKWNVMETWLLNVSLSHPVTSEGLNAGWVPSVMFDYSFGR